MKKIVARKTQRGLPAKGVGQTTEDSGGWAAMASHPSKTKRYGNAKPRDPVLGLPSKEKSLKPILTFSLNAWAKIQYFKANSNRVEVCGFGITREDNLLYVEDFVLIKQEGTSVFTSMDNDGIADHVQDYALRGIRPERSSRVWVHTHPNMRAIPSSHDENVFSKAFKDFSWAVMCIVGETDTSAKLRIKTPVLMDIDLAVEIDWTDALKSSCTRETLNALAAEYTAKVTPYDYYYSGGHRSYYRSRDYQDDYFYDWPSESTPLAEEVCERCGALLGVGSVFVDDNPICLACQEWQREAKDTTF